MINIHNFDFFKKLLIQDKYIKWSKIRVNIGILCCKNATVDKII